MKSSDEVAEILIGGKQLSCKVVSLKINQFSINLRSNSDELLNWCQYYFSHVLQSEMIAEPNIEIISIECRPLELNVDYDDWKREDKEKARKDAIYDLPDARILKKVRTGMIFLQSQAHLIAAGECLKNKNQIINFINTQYMTSLNNDDAMICHAAGLVYKNQVLGMAGFSGGGKSTLMLHMLSNSGSRFLSNDRLFIKKNQQDTQAIGIPKLPRINPGTIVHNPKLKSLISPERQKELLQLPISELWNLEEKYDVIIDEIYGVDKIQYQGEIKNFLVLNWKHDSNESVCLKKINLNERRDLLAAIMKSPGPFYQYSNGDLFHYSTPLIEQSYLDAFQNISTYEVSGRVDFHKLSQLCYEQIFN
ncbi:MAG: HprK-related kinase B [Gammaproteobacteria bacterium]|nr:HprK-related kinase B [Gammaproteobacteria bacterium]